MVVQLGNCAVFKFDVVRSMGLDKECLVVVIYMVVGLVVSLRKSVGIGVGVCGVFWVKVCNGVGICLVMGVVVDFMVLSV